MKKKNEISTDYLMKNPTRINWKIVAGPKLDYIQTYDLIFDDYDKKIRQIPV